MITGRRNFTLMAVGATLGAASLAGARCARAAANTKLAMQAAWVNDAEFLGYLVAIQNGYYQAEDVDMTYLSGGPDVIPESSLLAGKADLSLTTPNTTIEAITRQGAKFKIIGTQFQKSPLGIVSLAANPILKPSDLEGKVLAVPPIALGMIPMFLKVNGIDKSAVRIVPYEYDPTPLIKGEIDASVDFVTDVPFTLGLHGKKAVSFLLYDYGVTLYGDTAVVTEDFLASNRALLVKWLRASRRGWIENLKDPAVYPTKFKDTWFKGTGRETANDIFTNTADKPMIENPHGIFTMTEEGIAQNIDYLNRIGIKATRTMFDTTLVAEI